MTTSRDHVVLLGTKGGPAIRTGSTNPTSSLLSLDGQYIIVDCGLGVTRGLVDHGIALKEISLVFITHLHSDHYLELGPLLHTAWTAGLNTQVTIFGPKGLEDYWTHFLRSMRADIELRIVDEGRPDLAELVTLKTLDNGKVLGDGVLSVTAMRNIHPPLEDSFALRFSGTSNQVVFSGDTTYMPELATFAKEADLLVHEAMLVEALDSLFARIGNSDDRLMKHLLRSHTVASDAGKIASLAGTRALALNHLIPSDDPDFTDEHWLAALKPEWDGILYIGKDGMRIDL